VNYNPKILLGFALMLLFRLGYCQKVAPDGGTLAMRYNSIGRDENEREDVERRERKEAIQEVKR
jgi:hypothetical protein